MSELSDDLVALYRRFLAELEYNDAKGPGSYREGMHDGLHFAADALADVLRAHGVPVPDEPAPANMIPTDYGVR